MRVHMPMLMALLLLGVAMAGAVEAAAPAATRAAYSIEDTDLGTLLDDAAANAIVKKFAPMILEHPQLSLARPLTLAQLQRFGGDTLNDDVLAHIDAALKAAAPRK